MTSARTLVIAPDVLLRAEPASERSTLLVEVRPKSRPKTWRAVPNEDVDKHARTWAAAHGVTCEVASARGSCPNTSAVNPDAAQPVRLPSGHSTVGQPGETGTPWCCEQCGGPVDAEGECQRSCGGEPGPIHGDW